MKIGLNLIGKNFKTSFKRQYSNLKPLAKDTVSFQSMKKNQFFGIDLMMINKLKAPIGKFNSNDDFQNWCKDILERDYLTKTDELSKSDDIQAQEQKKKILSDWIDYITVENDAYTPAIQLMILSSITSTLDITTNHLPPNLDKRILADTIYEITQNSKNDKNYNCNFDKLYRNKLFAGAIQEETNIDPTLSGWIIIPSQANSPDNFEDNVKKLQILSHDTWCTKTYNAKPYLAKGDFHIYLEQGKPKLGVRFSGDEIQEIQGERNNSTIPVKYLDIAKAHVDDSNYKMNGKTKNEFQHAEKVKEEINALESKLKEQGIDFKTATAKQIFDFFNIKYSENEEGKLILEEYRQPSDEYTFDDLGINENKLFKDVVEIKGNAFFFCSKITSLGNLQSIGGNADFTGSKITSLGNLQSIGGNAYFTGSKITSLGNLQSIGGKASFLYSKITSLGNLQSIGGNADFTGSKITSLGNLQSIGGEAQFNRKIRESGELREFILEKRLKNNGIDPATATTKDIFNILGIKCIENNDGKLIIEKYCQPSSQYSYQDLGIDENELFKDVVEIKGNADFKDSQVTDLTNLRAISGNADFEGSKITSLGNLQTIGGNANFCFSNIADLGSLQTIGADASFEGSKITSLGNLQTIGADAYFYHSNVTDLGNLQSIGGKASFFCSKISSLGNLQSIGGDAKFIESEITSLGNLQTIGGNAEFRYSGIKDLGNLQSIGGEILIESERAAKLGIDKIKAICPKYSA